MKFHQLRLSQWRYYLSRANDLRKEFFYRDIYRKRILSTRGVVCDPDAPLEVHALTCQRDYLDLIWCLKTLSHFSKLPFHMVIHDDGSLGNDALEALSRHLMNSRIIRRAHADEEMKRVLKPFARCGRFRAGLVLGLKLFDFPHFATREQFLLLDSDILFFNPPVYMVQAIEKRQSFFMSDYQDAYIYQRCDLGTLHGLDVIEGINTGLAFLHRGLFDYEVMEDYCGSLKEEDYGHPWAEQTLIALLASRSGHNHERLPCAYQISTQAIDASSISHHFVNDGSRPRFYRDGLRFLRKSGFLDRYDAKP
jgi:hypothetical protein